MRVVLDQAAERGEPLAALFASEGAIYGRFGYGLAGLLGEFQAESARMAFVRGYEPSGRVELVSKEEALPIIDEVYDAAMRPGGVERNAALRDHNFATVGEDKDRPWMYAVHRDDAGTADAYAVYWTKHDWPRSVPSGTITVHECVASTPAGNADIWRFLFDVDLVATVEAWNRPADEPLLHLLREPRRLRFSVNDGLWVRLLDVVRGARSSALRRRWTAGVRGHGSVPSGHRRPVRAGRRRRARVAAPPPTRLPTSRARSTSWEPPTSGGRASASCGGRDRSRSAPRVRSSGRMRCSRPRPPPGASSTSDHQASGDPRRMS